MRKITMPSRIAICLLAGWISVGIPALSAAAQETEPSSETVLETPDVQEPDQPVVIDADEIRRTAEMLAEEMGEIDLQKLEKDIEDILAIINSEEFNELMAYPDVRELTEMAIVRLGNMAVEEPELAGKVFVTLGVEEKLVDTLVRISKLVQESEVARNLISDLLAGSTVEIETETEH